MEPLFGIAFVTCVCALLIGLTSHAAQNPAVKVNWLLVPLTWVQAVLAVLCVAFMLFGPTGEIQRSPATCYPMPDHMAQSMLRADVPKPDKNVDGMNGDTYCVRCLVWRPGHVQRGGPGHHCNICQRCVVGFDHHCNVFGRCITNSNMPCFYGLIVMFLAGVTTTGAALFLNKLTPVLA